MCLIVDANVAHRVFSGKADPDFGPVQEALLGRRAYIRMVVGGKLTTEYQGMKEIWGLVIQLNRMGRARLVPSKEVDAKAEQLDGKGICTSDDVHIIALAIVGKVRLLCTHDEHLTQDFKNGRLLSKPRGKVYRNAKHEELIRQAARACSRCGKRRS